MADYNNMANVLGYLDKPYKDSATGQSASLIDHLALTFLRVLDERPANPLELIEEYSREVKCGRVVAPGTSITTAFNTKVL